MHSMLIKGLYCSTDTYFYGLPRLARVTIKVWLAGCTNQATLKPPNLSISGPSGLHPEAGAGTIATPGYPLDDPQRLDISWKIGPQIMDLVASATGSH